MAGCGAAAMAENAKESFEEYINSAFPIDGKRTRSAVIRRSLAQRPQTCQTSRDSRDCPGNCPSLPASRKLTECPGIACQLASFPGTRFGI